MEQTRPCPIALTESHIFTNGQTFLTPTGSSILFIRNELAFLELGWSGHGKISQERQDQIVTAIVGKFADVTEDLGIPSDLSLIPELISQYNRISENRKSLTHIKSSEPLKTPA